MRGWGKVVRLGNIEGCGKIERCDGWGKVEECGMGGVSWGGHGLGQLTTIL